MEDNEIIDLFFERSDDAIIALSGKYGKIAMKMAKNVLGSTEDAEECVNDALLAVWNAIPPERPEPLVAFFCKIVRNISVNKRKYNAVKKRNSQYDLCLEEWEFCLSDTSAAEDALNARELARHISSFLSQTDETNRMLFVRRYWFMDSYEELSRRSGLKEGAVRTRMAWIKKALREHLIKEGVLYEQ